jgi:hypothetical protein
LLKIGWFVGSSDGEFYADGVEFMNLTARANIFFEG